MSEIKSLILLSLLSRSRLMGLAGKVAVAAAIPNRVLDDGPHPTRLFYHDFKLASL
jgi:hypothetical protein